MALTDWTIVTRSLRARLFSTVTTALTVAVAVALMLVLIVMRESGRNAFTRGTGNMHLYVSADASPLVSILNGIYYAGSPRRPIMWDKYESLAKAFPLEFAIPTQIGDSYKGHPVVATTPEFFSKLQPSRAEPWQLASGAFPTAEFQIVAGARAAKAAGLKLGDTLFLTHGSGDSRTDGGEAPHVHKQYAFTVVGILKPTGSAHDRALFTDLNAAWILHAHDRHEREEALEANANNPSTADHAEEHDHDHDHEHEAKLSDADLIPDDKKITGIIMRLITRDGSDTPASLPQVFDQLRRDTSITVAQPKQELDRLFAIVGNIDQILVGIAAVVMVSSGIAIMLALYNSMEQRRRQIAVLRVLGCSRPRVFGLVITESAVLGIAGSAVGLALSAAGAFIVAELMRRRLGLVIDPALPPREAAIVVLAAVFLAAAAGIIPAVMAYRTPVAKNLKPLG